MLFRHFSFSITWALIILLLSMVPGGQLPDLSFWDLLTFDKIMHIFMYGVLSFRTMMAASKQQTYWWMRYHAGIFTMAAITIYGGTIELMQEYLTIERTGDWVDMLANTIGLLIGIYVFRAVFYDCIRH
ncbi:MAG TPA: VanZ family protein [Bacteroidia bacterium]|nr:VanZ family protein [Bacteroidia bacterium]